MKQLTTPLIILLLLGTSLSGCFGKEEVLIQEEETAYPSIWDRHLLEWNTTHTHSFVLEPGPHYSLDVQEATIEVDTTGVWDGGPNSAEVHLSYAGFPDGYSGSLDKDLGMGEPFPTTVSVSGALILIYTLFSALVLLDGASGKWTVLHPSMFAFITVTISIFVGLIAGNARNASDQNQLDAMTGAVVMLLVLISYFRLKGEGVEDGITFLGEPVEDEGMWTNSLLLFALVMGALFAASEIILPMM